MSKFLTLYPGEYLPEGKAAMARVRAQIHEDLKRRDMTFSELVQTSDTRSRGLAYKVTDDPTEVQARMKALDPWNPIWFDETYAKLTGLPALPAPEGWPCPKGG